MAKEFMVGVVGLTGQSLFMRVAQFPLSGQTATCQSIFYEPGGKGHNQAAACARMGADVVFIGAIGGDAHGDICRSALEEANVRPRLAVYKQERTAFATVCVDDQGNNQVFCYAGASMLLRPEDIRHAEGINECGVLLTQMEIPDACISEVLRIGLRLNIPVVLNPAPARPFPAELLRQFYAITPNEHEASVLFGVDIAKEGYGRLARRVMDMGLKRVAVTLGGKGVLVIENEGYKLVEPLAVEKVVDTTGAGDIFNGSMTAALARGMSFIDAVGFGVVAAGLSVGKKGVSASIPPLQLAEDCFARLKGRGT